MDCFLFHRLDWPPTRAAAVGCCASQVAAAEPSAATIGAAAPLHHGSLLDTPHPTHRPIGCVRRRQPATPPPPPHASQSAPVAGPPTRNWRARGNGGASQSAARLDTCEVTKRAKRAAAATLAGGQRPPLPDFPPSAANCSADAMRAAVGPSAKQRQPRSGLPGKKKHGGTTPRCRPCNSPPRWAAPARPSPTGLQAGGGLRTAVNSAIGKNPVRHPMEAPHGRCVEGLAREPGSAGKEPPPRYALATAGLAMVLLYNCKARILRQASRSQRWHAINGLVGQSMWCAGADSEQIFSENHGAERN